MKQVGESAAAKQVSAYIVLDNKGRKIATVQAHHTPSAVQVDVWDETDNALEWPGGFTMRPKFKARESGTFIVRSADYSFTPDGSADPVYGDRKGAMIKGDSLVKTHPNGIIVTFTPEPSE